MNLRKEIIWLAIAVGMTAFGWANRESGELSGLLLGFGLAILAVLLLGLVRDPLNDLRVSLSPVGRRIVGYPTFSIGVALIVLVTASVVHFSNTTDWAVAFVIGAMVPSGFMFGAIIWAFGQSFLMSAWFGEPENNQVGTLGQ